VVSILRSEVASGAKGAMMKNIGDKVYIRGTRAEFKVATIVSARRHWFDNDEYLVLVNGMVELRYSDQIWDYTEVTYE